MSSFFNKFLTKTHLADISVAVAHPNISTQTLLSITAARGASVDGGSAARGAVVCLFAGRQKKVTYSANMTPRDGVWN